MSLNAVFEADRALRTAERSLLAGDKSALVKELAAAVTEAKGLGDVVEASMRLERLADLCAQVPGPEMADALIAILDEDEPSVRFAAGEALLDVAYDYYAEVAHAIDRALDRGDSGPAMSELPFILAEVGEPGAAKQLKRFLALPNADVVAATIEASALHMDPEMKPAIEALTGDERSVRVEEFEAETLTTIGDLAKDAVAVLSELDDND